MSLKPAAARLLAALTARKIESESRRAMPMQKKVLFQLLRSGRRTLFGRDHRLQEVDDAAGFRQAVPVREYEALRPYIERAKAGEQDVLWPGRPLYFCKTSGTTSGTKFIPLTRDSMPNHIGTARNALLCYIAGSGNSGFVDGKMIFLQGSPALDRLESGIPYGRLSGIVANHVPPYLQSNRLPSYETNCISDWETKVRAIVQETMHADMRLISGIPSWVQMYFEYLLESSGKPDIRSLFPHFSLFVFGGVNYEPYRRRMEQLMGGSVDTLETYPASEGFIAFQDRRDDDSLLLNVHSGIYFEFIPVEEVHQPAPRRLGLEEVETGRNYALVLSNNAGLWGYSIGDTIRFTSVDPPRIRVTGRIKHFTSAFGEHVIAEEVERAMAAAVERFGLKIAEFHVAPVVHPQQGLPYHEWIMEMDDVPVNLEEIALYLDSEMTRQNIYYRDLIAGGVLRTLVITPVRRGVFNEYMRAQGRLGGQNKVQRLANDLSVALALKSISG